MVGGSTDWKGEQLSKYNVTRKGEQLSNYHDNTKCEHLFKISSQTYSQAKYVFENVLELEEHTPTGPIVMNICKPELTKVIPVDF